MEIKTLPNVILRKKSSAVLSIDELFKTSLNQMIDLMYKSRGVGLSAVQVGILSRFFIVDISDSNIKNSGYTNIKDPKLKITYPLILINPQITFCSHEKEILSEGCLSIPGIHVHVPRHHKVTVEFFDLNMAKYTISCSGLLARVIQHEYDHLNGKLIIDYLSYMKRKFLMKKFYKNIEKNAPNFVK